MGNWWVAPADRPKALTTQTLKALRREQPRGLSRRQLLRNAIGTGIGLWLLEVTGGMIGFLWPNLSSGFGGKVRLGTFSEIQQGSPTSGFERGFPAYFQAARTYAVVI